jgi:flagellin-like protein
MKAVSPVIATLILIAIAVIAGVFVLRQFLFLANTSASQQMLQVQDAVLYLATKPQKINATYIVNWISIELEVSVKNVGDRIVTITNITVDDLPVQGFTSVNINPGQVYTGSYTVILNPTTGETRILYTPEWEKGTTHTVKIQYQVLGTTNIQSVVATATVM